jgi:hypothetical protein
VLNDIRIAAIANADDLTLDHITLIGESSVTQLLAG